MLSERLNGVMSKLSMSSWRKIHVQKTQGVSFAREFVHDLHPVRKNRDGLLKFCWQRGEKHNDVGVIKEKQKLLVNDIDKRGMKNHPFF